AVGNSGIGCGGVAGDVVGPAEGGEVARGPVGRGVGVGRPEVAGDAPAEVGLGAEGQGGGGAAAPGAGGGGRARVGAEADEVFGGAAGRIEQLGEAVGIPRGDVAARAQVDKL